MILSLRPMQEKCRERRLTLFLAFIYFKKAFDMLSRDGHSKKPPKIGYPPRLLNILKFFLDDMTGTMVFNQGV